MSALLLYPGHATLSPGENMGLDAALLAEPPDAPILRTYEWTPPTLTLGRFQRVEAELIAFCQQQGLGVTRRTTGGGAILHAGELTYSLVARCSDLGVSRSPPEAYRLLHAAWIRALADTFGFDPALLWTRETRYPGQAAEGEERTLCFSRRTDFDVLADVSAFQLMEKLALRGCSEQVIARLTALLPESDAEDVQRQAPAHAKIIGSAQRRRGDWLLQHGSIKLAPSPFAPWVGSISQVIGRLVHAADWAEALASSFAMALGRSLQSWSLDACHHSRAASEAAKRFDSPAWITRD